MTSPALSPKSTPPSASAVTFYGRVTEQTIMSRAYKKQMIWYGIHAIKILGAA